MKLKIKRSKKEFYFHLQAANGRILMHSETYKRIPWHLINKIAISLNCAIINETISQVK
jgi:hypothetical protein